MASKRSAPSRAQTAFEDTVRRILKAEPMPKGKAKPKGKKAPKVRPRVTK